jgi:hypothetical protein
MIEKTIFFSLLKQIFHLKRVLKICFKDKNLFFEKVVSGDQNRKVNKYLLLSHWYLKAFVWNKSKYLNAWLKASIMPTVTDLFWPFSVPQYSLFQNCFIQFSSILRSELLMDRKTFRILLDFKSLIKSEEYNFK